MRWPSASRCSLVVICSTTDIDALRWQLLSLIPGPRVLRHLVRRQRSATPATRSVDISGPLQVRGWYSFPSTTGPEQLCDAVPVTLLVPLLLVLLLLFGHVLCSVQSTCNIQSSLTSFVSGTIQFIPLSFSYPSLSINDHPWCISFLIERASQRGGFRLSMCPVHISRQTTPVSIYNNYPTMS